jgi:hypothetical protein
VPNLNHILAHYLAQHVDHIIVAIGAWKNDYTKFHGMEM